MDMEYKNEQSRYAEGMIPHDLELPPELLFWLADTALQGAFLLWEDEDSA